MDRDKVELLAGDLMFNRTNSKELVGKTGLWDGRFEAVAASYFILWGAKTCHAAAR
jgi:type I restriction enzyme S subunit